MTEQTLRAARRGGGGFEPIRARCDGRRHSCLCTVTKTFRVFRFGFA